MLKIYLGEMEGAIYHPPTYFDNRYEDEWITKPLSVEMIKDIDKSVVVGPHLIQSPFNASVCGDNCAKWILKISREKDLTINLRHIMEFPEEEFQAEILNNGVIVRDMNTFVDIAAEYV